jgi:hypothetical protein
LVPGLNLESNLVLIFVFAMAIACFICLPGLRSYTKVWENNWLFIYPCQGLLLLNSVIHYLIILLKNEIARIA